MGKRSKKSRQGTSRKARPQPTTSSSSRGWKVGYGLWLVLTTVLASGVALWLLVFPSVEEPSRAPSGNTPDQVEVPVAASLEATSNSPANMISTEPLTPVEFIPVESPGYDDFVGAQACASCHEKQYQQWSRSTHGRAGGRPVETEILAAFDGNPLEFSDAVVRPIKIEGGGYGFVVEYPGRPSFTIKVDAVVGGGHMYGGGTQSFFNEFPDGTLRFLPFDFIRKENHWFVQLRRNKHWVPISRDIRLDSDLANWPPHRVLGSSLEFSNCQNCHGSQLNLAYDHNEKRFETKFSSLGINCESCHGPGRRHVELAGRADVADLVDLGMPSLDTLDRDESLEVCFQCHALKDQLQEADYLPGMDLESYYSLKLPMFGESSYQADGRISSFGYQLNHLFSDCYRNGSMTCVDCHDPHDQSYRDVWGRALIGKFDDGQCTSCHPSKAQEGQQHTHHAPGTMGSRCVDCHMPFLQHPGVGDQLVFSRSDHTIPIPRPGFDESLGVENACQKCHAEKGVAWQEEAMQRWYGKIKPHHPMVTSLLRAGQIEDPRQAAEMLLDSSLNHPMAQMAGLALFLEKYLQPGQPSWDPWVGERLLALSRLDDVDLKSFSLMILQVVYGSIPEARNRVDEVLGGEGISLAKVKRRWAVAADRWGTRFLADGKLAEAILCTEKSLEVMPDNVVTLTHLAQGYERAKRLEEALVIQLKAVSLQPQRGTLHFQLARIYHAQGDTPKAITALEEGLKHAPGDVRARSMLQYLRSP